MNELKKISKDKWFGLPYGTFHHTKFSVLGSNFHKNPKAQRNTAERFNMIGITADIVKDKVILDLGCNTGAMLCYAMQLGAHKVLGIDNDREAIHWTTKLFKYLNYNGYFICKDINQIEPKFFKTIKPDIIFCFAISKWVDYDNLIKLLSESGAPLIFFEDNNVFGEIVKDVIPGYDCKFVWFSGPEANTDIGWKRANYICQKK